MAQSSNAQREPSMEEILASIRRIIEDSDAPRTAGEREGASGFGSADIRDLEAFRAGIQAPAPSAETEPQDARVSEPDHEDKPASSQYDSPSAELRPSFSADLAIHQLIEQTSPASAASIETSDEPAPGPQTTTAGEASADYDDALFGFQDLLDNELKQMPELRGAPAPASIVSDRTGRQVAAAFGELSEAFAATRQKSFDEMAEAMIRPMLSEWLDNNLPTLVERLVREEIERIARGPAA